MQHLFEQKVHNRTYIQTEAALIGDIGWLPRTIHKKEMNMLLKRFSGKHMTEVNYYDFNNVLNKYNKMIEDEKEAEMQALIMK